MSIKFNKFLINVRVKLNDDGDYFEKNPKKQIFVYNLTGFYYTNITNINH